MATNKTIGTLLFRIESDTKALRKGMAQTKNSINGLKKSFNSIAIAAAAAFSVREVSRFTKEIVKLAGEMEGVGDAFRRIAPAGLLEDLQEATKNTVTNLDLMKRAVMAHNFQIPLSQLASLFAFATKRAQQTGESVDFLVNSIVIGIGRKSPLILDNLGISAVRLREELNNAGHSGATVFQVAQAVGKIAQKEMAAAGDIILTTTVATEQLTAAWGNLKLELGEVVNEHFKLANVLTKVTTALANLNPENNKFLKDIEGITRTVIMMNPALVSTFLLLGKIRDRSRAVTGPSRAGLGVISRAPAPAPAPSRPGAPSAIASIGIGRIDATPADVLKFLQDVAPSVAQNITDSLNRIAEGGKNLKTAYQGIHEIVTRPMLELGLVVQQAFMGAADAFGMFVESIAAGNMENAFNSILRVFGGFIVQMGKMVFAYGVSMLAIQTAFTNPAGAIAAGLALIAIGSAISGLASRGPSMAGVSASGSTGGAGFATARSTAVLRGQDIYIAGQRGLIALGQNT